MFIFNKEMSSYTSGWALILPNTVKYNEDMYARYEKKFV